MTLRCSVVALLAVISGAALAQQYGDVAPGQFRTDIILDLTTNPAIREELHISEEVATKLSALRDEYRAAVQKGYKDAGVDPVLNQFEMTFEQRRMYREIAQKLNDEFVPKVKELLTADQNKRLAQIQLQGRFRNLVPAVLRGLAELKLNEEQKQKLSALSGEMGRGVINSKIHEEYTAKAMEVLTAEQKETLKGLQGETFDLTRLVPRTPRTPRPPRLAPPGKGK
jgi:hypothetical protein